jgi:deoxyribose-phosphate aldolase
MTELSSKIDHTLLKPVFSKRQVTELCEEAMFHGFASVCISPYFVQFASSILKESEVLVCSVAGFPYGHDPISSKAECVKKLAHLGAQEVDVVVNLCAIENNDWSYLSNEFNVLSTCAHMNNCKIKGIIEAALFTDEQIRRVCELCIENQFDFVKTSTGVLATGANVEMIRKIKECVGDKALVKASGGIKTYDQAIQLIRAGASRLGTSSSINIIEGKEEV